MPEPLLPPSLDESAFDALLRQKSVWQAAIAFICRKHGLETISLTPFDQGSSVIWSIQTNDRDLVLKLMPPFWAKDCANEIAVLTALASLPDLPVPRVLFEGELEGWPYFIMKRLQGTPADKLWPHMSMKEQIQVMNGLGLMLRNLHRAPITGLQAVTPDWPVFVADQSEQFIARQKAWGRQGEQVEKLADDLAEMAPELAQAHTRVLMHCELMPAHLLLQKQAEKWRISGLYDFGDPLVGMPEYELGTACITFTAGKPELRRALLLAYGYAESELNSGLSRRLLGAALLHRFGSVAIGFRLLDKIGSNLDFADSFFSLG